MSKHPYIPLYTGDWKKDPQLALCSVTTRGIWFELICCMHDGNVGTLSATTEQFARLARCTHDEMERAITELSSTGTGVIELNLDGSKTIGCRRLMRKQEISKLRMVSGSKGGVKTQAKREQSPEYDNENEGVLRVREFVREEGGKESDADWFFWKCHANGWTNGGRQILDWKATFRSWQRAGYLPSQKQQSKNGSKPPERVDYKSSYLPPQKEISDEELQRNREIVRQETEKLRQQFRMQ
jgi:hypothetical protein